MKNLEKLNLRPPAPIELLSAIAGIWDAPSDYCEFLRQSNGAEGFIGDNYLIVFPVEEVESINQAASIERYAPGLTIFASDGGGKSYAFDRRKKPIVVVEFYDMDIGDEEPMFLADSFTSFLARLARGDEAGHY